MPAIKERLVYAFDFVLAVCPDGLGALAIGVLGEIAYRVLVHLDVAEGGSQWILLGFCAAVFVLVVAFRAIRIYLRTRQHHDRESMGMD